MKIADLIDAMSAAGAPIEAISIAVRAVEEKYEELRGHQSELAERLAKDAARTRLYRSRGGGQIPDALRQEVFARDGFACVYCSATERLSCDHDIPVSKGGETTRDNLLTACRSCNSKKRDRDRKAFVRALEAEKSGRRADNIGHSAENPVSTPSPSPETKSVSPTPPSEKTQPLALTPPPIVPRPSASDFDEFWLAYPSKVGKTEARKAYDRALGRIAGPDPPSVILAGVHRAATGERWKRGIVPNPATWLNQGRWEDEIELFSGANGTNGHATPASQRAEERRANNARGFNAPRIVLGPGGAGG